MLDLVAFARHLHELSQSRDGALDLAVRLSREGSEALGAVSGDRRQYLESTAQALGLISDEGQPDPTRTSELVLVCAIVRQVERFESSASPEPEVLFTVPPEAEDLVGLRHRIAMAIEDTIRMARRSLVIGGPFWDEPGFARLLEVLRPAVHDRNVDCTFYVHAWPDEGRRETIRSLIARLGTEPNVTTHWYRGSESSSLMHAKFVLADSSAGVLGTANLTSYGLEQHVEVAVHLTEHQCMQLESLLEGLRARGLFRGGTEVVW